MAVHLPGVRGGADGDSGDVQADQGRWPLSAVLVVTALALVALGLLAINLMGLRLRDGEYDPEAGGTVADWFAAFATLVAVPAAVLVGVRQLRSTSAALDLTRRQIAADEADRARRVVAEEAALADAVRLAVRVLCLVEAEDLTTSEERAAADRWRAEYRQRGWAPSDDGAGWVRGEVRRSHAEQLAGEHSPLLPQPWLVAVECRNHGAAPFTATRWEVSASGESVVLPGPVEIGPGEVVRHRLDRRVGLRPGYAERSSADDAAAAVVLALDGHTAGRPIRILHPLPG